MNNREALLDAAKRCLFETGYQRTTARDIATEAGVSLAAIGYHFGSKEALLNAALIEAIGEWGNELGSALVFGAYDAETDPLKRFELFWTRVIELFDDYRQMWKANFELLTIIDQLPDDVRQVIVDAQHMGREGMALLVQGLTVEDDARQTNVVGAFYQALLLGLMVQWLSAPQHAPSGRDLTDALRAILKTVEASGGSTVDSPE